MAGARSESRVARLRRAGFVDPARADELLEGVDNRDQLIDWLSTSADPDQGLLAYLRLADATNLTDHLAKPGVGEKLAAVLGMSTALGDLLISNPSWLDLLAHNSDTLTAPEIDGVDWEAGVGNIRDAYYRDLLGLATADLIHPEPQTIVDQVAATMSDLVAHTLESAYRLAAAHTPGADRVEFAVIALGKAGARELNYISDVDVVFVAEPIGEATEAKAIDIATTLAQRIRTAVSEPGSRPPLWPLDTNLRPEGKDGPLVRTLDSYLAYYERWAHDWEFQAQLKARHVAGSAALGERYVAGLEPLVWSAASRADFVESSRHLRQRVEQTIPSAVADRQLKLGPGGLRDIEFTVQLLQLVHGRVDETLRIPGTLPALAALREGGYIARTDADALDEHYRFLRLLEHRLQLQRLRRSHLIPTADAELRRVARSLRLEAIGSADELRAAWQSVKRHVRSLHQAIYYRPLLPEAARLNPADVSLAPEAARDRLAAIGYRDPAGAMRHIEALTAGISRRAKIQRQLLPVLLGWFADGPEPDAGLLGFRVLSDEMGTTHWYLKLLRDSGVAARRLAWVLSGSRFVADHVPRLPESVAWLDSDDDLRPRSREDLTSELEALMSRRDQPLAIALAGRYLRRRTLLRASLALMCGVPDVSAGHAIGDAAEVAIHAAMAAAQREVLEARGLDEAPSDYLVVGMGSFGGREMTFASDADILFVHRPRPGVDHELAQAVATDVATALIALLGQGSDEPPLKVDTDLRPEGRDGPIARSLDSYREYLSRWALTWERQALVRARPVWGPPDLADAFTDLIDPLRYPEGGLTASEVRDIRTMKARIERERLPRGTDPTRHLKMGRGAMMDVEWTVQLLQLTHGAEFPSLQTTSTLDSLAAAIDAGLLPRAASGLAEAWRFAYNLRNAMVLATGRLSGNKLDLVPREPVELGTAAIILGVPLDRRHDVEENYLRLTRQARAQVEQHFWGGS